MNKDENNREGSSHHDSSNSSEYIHNNDNVDLNMTEVTTTPEKDYKGDGNSNKNFETNSNPSSSTAAAANKPSGSNSNNNNSSVNYTAVCIPCAPSTATNTTSETIDLENTSNNNTTTSSSSMMMDLTLTKEARIISNQILHRTPSLPPSFQTNNTEKITNDNHETNLDTKLPSKPFPTSSSQNQPNSNKSSNHLSNFIIQDILQTPCPFITPSLLCSHENPFDIVQEMIVSLEERKEGDGGGLKTMNTMASASVVNYKQTKKDNPFEMFATGKRIGIGGDSSGNSGNHNPGPSTNTLSSSSSNHSSTDDTNHDPFLKSILLPSKSSSTSNSIQNFNIPSIIGPSIDTSIHLLHSIQYIEMDYFDDVNYNEASFYHDMASSSSSSSAAPNVNNSNGSRNHNNDFGFGGFLQFGNGGGGIGGNYYHNRMDDDDINSVLASSLISVLSRVYHMDLSMYHPNNVHNSSGGGGSSSSSRSRKSNNQDGTTTYSDSLGPNAIVSGDIIHSTTAIATNPFIAPATSRTRRRRRSLNASTTTPSTRNFQLLERRIRRQRLYYNHHHNFYDTNDDDLNDTIQIRTGNRNNNTPIIASTAASTASATAGTATNTTNNNFRRERSMQDTINRVFHQFRTTIQNQQHPVTTDHNTNSTGTGTTDTGTGSTHRDILRQQYHHSISQVIDEDNNETYTTMDRHQQNQQHNQNPSSFSTQKEKSNELKKEWVYVMNEERHETIAQLTQLILDEIESSPSSSTKQQLQLSQQRNPLSYQKYKPTSNATKYLNSKYTHIPKRVCQHPFRKNDIVWVCRTCQA